MKKKNQIILIIFIFCFVTLLSYLTGEKLILLLYSTILALYVEELKTLFNRISNKNQIRISYSYLFRIEVNGCYLLVKDEQGRNNYHPVGGVYKYNPDEIDISERFSCEYDNLYNSTEDTQDDLRLVIKRSKYKLFKQWFASLENRENINDLSREFTEELLDSHIIPKGVFNKLQYKYIGSYTQKTYNKQLKMQQIRHFDIVSIKLTQPQRNCLNKLKSQQSDIYVFATKQHIADKHLSFGGHNYDIAEYSNLIVANNDSQLTKEINDNNKYYDISF